MVKKFPIGLSTLKDMRDGYYYVDKTPFVYTLANSGKYYFLSRPRRFGKSLLLDTIKQAFLGNQDVFNDLYLEHHWDWSKKYPVIHIAFTSNQPNTINYGLEDKLKAQLQMNAENYGISLRGESYSDQFGFLVKDLYIQHQETGVVILIDEYDKPILDQILDPVLAGKNRDILRGFYSVIKEHDSKIQFAFLTGVSKFSKTGVFSGLNNLNDITYDTQYGTICGYTQQELEDTFKPHLEANDLPNIKAWYNGYYFLGHEGVYNPFSILSYFAKGKRFSNYWFTTGTPTFLINLIRERHFYIPQLEQFEVNEDDLDAFDIETLPLPTLLLQTGYLTIASSQRRGAMMTYILSYPNLEVRMSLNNRLSRMAVSDTVKSLTDSAINKALIGHDLTKLKEVLTSLFASIPHDWYRNNDIQHYEGFYCATVYTYLMGLGYQAIAEDVTSQGQIDITLIVDDHIVIIEFKLTTYGDAASAVEQIKRKRYAEKYLSLEKPIYLLGLSFNPDQRNVEDCVFEKSIAF
ncbi:MAG: ATP-binding protein [Gammaproteobacteria bacterium]|nr:ATP-binding protein [Gammaproteobacteria bacterium]